MLLGYLRKLVCRPVDFCLESTQDLLSFFLASRDVGLFPTGGSSAASVLDQDMARSDLASMVAPAGATKQIGARQLQDFALRKTRWGVPGGDFGFDIVEVGYTFAVGQANLPSCRHV